VLPHHPPGEVEDRAGRGIRDEGRDARRGEAQVLALPEPGRRQAEGFRQGLDLGLRPLAHREQSARELGAADAVEEIGLVLGMVGSAPEVGPVLGVADPGVVPGGDERDPARLRLPNEEGEPHLAVADRARVGGEAALVGGERGRHDEPAEFRPDLDHLVGDPQLTGGEGSRIHRAAGVLPSPGGIPKPQGQAVDLVARLTEEVGSDRGVHPPR
jgi:hypothetical protein